MRFRNMIAIVLALSTLLLCACGGETAEPTQTAATEATTVPTTVATEPVTEATTEPTAPAAQLHSGIREDGSFDSGTLFIGDSLTYGLVYSYLMANDLIGDARYMATVGAPVQAFFNGPALSPTTTSIYSWEFENMLYCDAVAQVGEEATAIYFMMGTNYSADTKASTYIEIVDHMLEHCPNATIYLQMVPYSDSSNVEYDMVNWIIMETYTHYAMEGNPRVKMVDVKHAVGVNLTDDGVHLTYKGQECWYEALVAFAEDNGIPQ